MLLEVLTRSDKCLEFSYPPHPPTPQNFALQIWSSIDNYFGGLKKSIFVDLFFSAIIFLISWKNND